MSWKDFSDAEEQTGGGDIIPHRTPVKVHMKIRPGGYNDASQGWDGGVATQSDSGAIYLDCEFTIIGGKYSKRKVWSLVGLHSPKGDAWENMGRAFVRAALESARNIKADDKSEMAKKARQINGLQDLDGLEFCALVEVQKAKPDSQYSDKNVIQTVIGVGHKDYQALMSGQAAAPEAAKSAGPKSGSLPAWAS